eukprot:g61760.t1
MGKKVMLNDQGTLNVETFRLSFVDVIWEHRSYTIDIAELADFSYSSNHHHRRHLAMAREWRVNPPPPIGSTCPMLHMNGCTGTMDMVPGTEKGYGTGTLKCNVCGKELYGRHNAWWATPE